MDKFLIDGGPLRGRARVSGSKNAALPILIATLLTDEPCVVENVPDLRDIRTTLRLLKTLGKDVSYGAHRARVRAGGPLSTAAPYDLVRRMRASVLVAGPLLARFAHARTALPGGCAIGLRPIDIHLEGFRALGARVRAEGGDAVLEGALRPGRARLRFPSVGATENLMMAAAAVEGRTLIENAAREPEIADLGAFLAALGARVRGAGSSRVEVEGRARLRGARHRVIPDRIEAGTLLIACAAAGGEIFLEGARGVDLEAVLGALRRSGARVREGKGGLRLRACGRPRPVSIRTRPYPGFPTDLQAPWLAYMARARGVCRVREDIFERRFLHAAELSRMGARARVSEHEAVVTGVARLAGAPVMASDIRAGAALVVAALSAEGRSEVLRVYHIDRGYERLEAKLRLLGARARRVRE